MLPPLFSLHRLSLLLLLLFLLVSLLLAGPVEAGWLGSLFGRKDKQQVRREGGREGGRKCIDVAWVSRRGGKERRREGGRGGRARTKRGRRAVS